MATPHLGGTRAGEKWAGAWARAMREAQTLAREVGVWRLSTPGYTKDFLGVLRGGWWGKSDRTPERGGALREGQKEQFQTPTRSPQVP